MTKPRSHYIDSDYARYYHITSRCVRRAFLLGQDSHSGKDYSHRKDIFLARLKHLSRFFSVEIMGYSVMSNHFHLVVRFDPNASTNWSSEEVARRWCALFHGHSLDTLDAPTEPHEFDLYQSSRYHEMLLSPSTIERCRKALSDLSRFMQHLKQPFSVWANREDRCRGHFFEHRFYSGVLLNHADLLACMAYVDLNPVEAGIAHSLSTSEDTAIHERLYSERFSPAKLDAYLSPLWHEEEQPDDNTATLPYTLLQYARQLNLAIIYRSNPHAPFPDDLEDWMARLLNRERRSRSQAPAFFDYA